MRRREFIALVGGGVGAWPLAARGQAKRPRIAVLTLLSPLDEGGRIGAFTAGLRALGYVGGQTADIDYRYAAGDTTRLPALASELMTLKPDVVFAGEASPARAIKAIAPNVPIICPTLGQANPDLFASFARPGGSVTGLAGEVENIYGKWVEIALDFVPQVKRIGLLVNPAGANRAFVIAQVETASRARGVAVLVEDARAPDELSHAFDDFTKTPVQVVVVPPNGMFLIQRKAIVQLALAANLPTIFQQPQDAAAGGFISYGVEESENSRRAALYVDKILKGAKPGDLPIEFPTEIKLTINLKTAKALGVPISRDMLLRADQVIE
jgi:putative tryptophan/tyrosine transport system substrate-binding protein